jgi:hypothetical protein
MTIDPNLQDFNARVARLERAHRRGEGFESVGTLGRSHYRRRRRSPARHLLTLFVVLLLAAVFKGVVHRVVGPAVYEERVAALRAGEGFDRLGGLLMTPDPLTRAISAQVAPFVPDRL